MYKKRLRVWKLKKNYTKEDKEKALDRLHLHEPEDTVASITINNMPLKSSRLGRPVQQNGRRVPLRHGNLRRPRPVITTQAFDGRRNSMTASLSAAMNHDSPVLSNNKLAVTEADLSHGLIPRIQLQQSPESRRIEQILRFAQSYWSSYATQPASHRNYGFGKDLEDVFDNLVTARRFLGRNDTRAFVMLNKACFGIRALLMAQPYRLLDQIILEFSNPQWSTHGQIRVSLLSYLESMSQRFLRPEHPVSKTAACLAVNGNATELTSKFSRLCIDTASSTLADSQYDVVIDIQYNVLYFLEQSGNLDDADRLCQQMDILCQKIVKAKEKSDGACVAAREASKVLAWIRGRRNDFKSAERILLQTVEDTIQATGLPNGDRAGIGVCSDLGTVYRCLGNATESAKYFRLAIEGGLWLWGEDSTEVLDNVRRLEVVLGKYGMEEQLKQLRKRWKRVWERLENELKN
jgi:hypothetical protein